MEINKGQLKTKLGLDFSSQQIQGSGKVNSHRGNRYNRTSWRWPWAAGRTWRGGGEAAPSAAGCAATPRTGPSRRPGRVARCASRSTSRSGDAWSAARGSPDTETECSNLNISTKHFRWSYSKCTIKLLLMRHSMVCSMLLSLTGYTAALLEIKVFKIRMKKKHEITA